MRVGDTVEHQQQRHPIELVQQMPEHFLGPQLARGDPGHDTLMHAAIGQPIQLLGQYPINLYRLARGQLKYRLDAGIQTTTLHQQLPHAPGGALEHGLHSVQAVYVFVAH